MSIIESFRAANETPTSKDVHSQIQRETIRGQNE